MSKVMLADLHFVYWCDHVLLVASRMVFLENLFQLLSHFADAEERARWSGFKVLVLVRRCDVLSRFFGINRLNRTIDGPLVLVYVHHGRLLVLEWQHRHVGLSVRTGTKRCQNINLLLGSRQLLQVSKLDSPLDLLIELVQLAHLLHFLVFGDYEVWMDGSY